MKFRKKPIVVEAFQWFEMGDHKEVESYLGSSKDKGGYVCYICKKDVALHGWIITLEGGHLVCPGDWIVDGEHGGIYSYKPDIFKEIYEKAEDLKLRKSTPLL